ncbi:Aste57867_860 [Aphanomyces stellatus]|uniref:Aste57867_860 protein n=1 Tax=Aphanomyces stellatus TaxID=120398 RepID=A0A485K6D3_9STRA|nr:hypothetical protein As57867_000859 [Aphanomyces stellatus]VFT78084.1 Aste57867_860 [Aphanomyces stellatus]
MKLTTGILSLLATISYGFSSPSQDANDDIAVNLACHKAHNTYLRHDVTPGQYTSSDFFKCFRTADQVEALLDRFVAQNPTRFQKTVIGTTVLGAPIPAYTLSTGNKTKRGLYIQSQLHAREWAAVSSHVYALAAFLDDMSLGKPGPYDLYDLVNVPLVNIDGYHVSWETNRLQRENIRGVDLNRQWPTPMVNPHPVPMGSEDWPGPTPFSEPETQAIRDFVQRHRDGLDGFLGVHTYGGDVMYPFGDTLEVHHDEYKYRVLTSNVVQAIGGDYITMNSWGMYLAYGCFQDWIAREFKKPVLTIEMAGQDFIVAASTIAMRGQELYRAIQAFAPQVEQFLTSPGAPLAS